MAKKGIVTKSRTMAPCVCSQCGQKSTAQVGTTHFGCHGMPAGFFDKAPMLKGRISHPERKGKWEAVVVEVAAA